MKRLQLKTPWKAENIALRDALSVSPETPLADILHKIQAREQAHAKLANAHHDLVEACLSAYDWLSQCHEGTHQRELADELHAALVKADVPMPILRLKKAQGAL